MTTGQTEVQLQPDAEITAIADYVLGGPAAGKLAYETARY